MTICNSPSWLPISLRQKLDGGGDESLFVWVSSIVTVIGTLLVARLGRSFPYADDWILMPVVTGEEPMTIRWLWEPHVGHRIVIPKLIFLVLYNASVGYDFRAGAFVNVGLLSALGFGLVLAARRWRGRTSYSDAFFLLALLNPGLGPFWNFHLNFVCSTVLAGALLLLIVQQDNSMSTRRSLVAGVCVALLPFAGLNGLVLVPAFVLWLIFSAIRQYRLFPKPAQIMLLFAALSIFVSVWSLVGNRSSAPEFASPGLMATVNTTVSVLSAGLGSPLFSEVLHRWPQWRLLMFVALIVGGVAVGRGELRIPEERQRAVGLLLFLGAFVSLALAIGLGRGARSWGALDEHYGIAAVPVLLWLYVVADLYLPSAVGRLIRMSLFALMCGIFMSSSVAAVELGYSLGRKAAVIERDLRAGVPLCELTEKHIWQLHGIDTGWSRKEVVAGLRGLHRANAGPFKYLRDDEPESTCKWKTAPAN